MTLSVLTLGRECGAYTRKASIISLLRVVASCIHLPLRASASSFCVAHEYSTETEATTSRQCSATQSAIRNDKLGTFRDEGRHLENTLLREIPKTHMRKPRLVSSLSQAQRENFMEGLRIEFSATRAYLASVRSRAGTLLPQKQKPRHETTIRAHTHTHIYIYIYIYTYICIHKMNS